MHGQGFPKLSNAGGEVVFQVGRFVLPFSVEYCDDQCSAMHGDAMHGCTIHGDAC